MKIKKLHLENFRQFEDLEITFPELSNVAVFIGENGCGKSTVLDALEMLLRIITRDVGRTSTSWIDINDIQKNKQENDCIISLNGAGFMHEFIFDLKYIHFVNGIRGGLSPVSPFSSFLKERLQNENSLPILLSFKTKSEPLATFKGLTLRSKNIYDYCWDYTQNTSTFKSWFDQEENIENEIRLNENMNYKSPILSVVRKAIETFLINIEGQSIFKNLRIKRVALNKPSDDNLYDTFLVVSKNGTQFELEQLSTGEISLLIIVSEIARRAAISNEKDPHCCHGIVLIDEIDQHLHPKWQRRILPALTKTFPNVQFIVTTHSPQVLSGAPNGSVFGLKDGKVYQEKTFGRDNNWILQTVMDDDDRPVEIKQELERYFGFIRTGQEAEAIDLRKHLEALIGSDEPEFVKADILMRRKFPAK